MIGTSGNLSVRLRVVVMALAAAVGMATLIGVAAPVQAADTITLQVLDGKIGVQQTVRATVTTDLLGAPTGTITFTADGATIGARQIGGTLGSSAQITWVPQRAGLVTVIATFAPEQGDTVQDSRTVTIATGSSATAISTPGTAAANSTIQLSATVRSSTGQYIPTGSVTFFTGNGAQIGSAGLSGQGVATITYQTPNQATTVNVYATYGGDGNVGPSRSRTDSIRITKSAASVAVTAPQTNYVNTPVTITATINPAVTGGTVRFSADDNYIGTTSVSKGVATITWTPQRTGAVWLTAQFSGSGNVDASTGRNQVVVTQPLKADQLTVTPAGGSGPWVPGETITLVNGASLQLSAASASGIPVTLGVNGPCSLDGSTLHVNGVGGTCVLTASTPGGNGYAPASQTYNVVPAQGVQVAEVVAPPSGKYKAGKTLKLSKRNTVTNVGQPVTWKILEGKKYCRIKTGAWFKLELKKKGTCRVAASAPAVPGQWTAWGQTRTYKIKK